jgi:hypothetical protein
MPYASPLCDAQKKSPAAAGLCDSTFVCVRNAVRQNL